MYRYHLASGQMKAHWRGHSFPNVYQPPEAESPKEQKGAKYETGSFACGRPRSMKMMRVSRRVETG